MRDLRKPLAVLAALVLVVLTQCDSHGGIFRHRARRQPAQVVYSQCNAQATTVQAAAVVMTTTPTVAPTGGSFSDALAVINAARGAFGRAPLAWDANLAAWASRNWGTLSNPHQVQAPGAGQCQAWFCDPVGAAYQWLASPAHWAILSTATTAIGISYDAGGGVTANAR